MPKMTVLRRIEVEIEKVDAKIAAVQEKEREYNRERAQLVQARDALTAAAAVVGGEKKAGP